jgi:hypothetical protein
VGPGSRIEFPILPDRAPRAADRAIREYQRLSGRDRLVTVRFSVEHQLPGPAPAVAAILCDPSFHTSLDLPDVGRPEVLEHVKTAAGCHLQLRYAYTGQIDAWAKKLIGSRSLSWIQEFDVDTTTGKGTLTFGAEADRNRLQGEAQIDCTPSDDGTTTTQRIAGELRVKMPLVGGTAERKLVPGVVRRLDVMADALASSLKSQR